MAENEYLDISRSHRWHRVYDAVRDDKPIYQIIDLCGISLRKVIKNLRKPLYVGGPPQVPLGDFLNAFEHGPGALDDTVRRCRGHDFAALFRDASCGATSRREAVEQFLSAVLERISDQIEHRIVCPDGQRTFGRIRSTLDQVQEGLKPEIGRLAEQLAADPEGRLTRPRGERILVPDTRSILRQSLLGVGNA
jgi:hypothetical protein